MIAGCTAALNESRYVGTNAHKQSQPSQQKPACLHQSRTCWIFPRGCEACAAVMLWLRPMGTENAEYKSFFSLGRKSKAKEQFYNNDFRKAVVFNSIADALRHLHTSKCKRPHNRPYNACLWKPAKRKKVQTSKQLRFVSNTETFLWNQALIIRVNHITIYFLTQ